MSDLVLIAKSQKTASDGDSIKTSTCLPRQKALDVTKRHACHAKDRGVTGHKRGPSMSQVPRLPRKSKVNVTKRHACHAKCVWMSPSATPATQKTAASPATSVDQACHKSQPSEHKCHACHAKARLSPSATPARPTVPGCHQAPRLPRNRPRRHRRRARTKRVTVTRASPAPQARRLPCKSKVNVTKCHACHVWVSCAWESCVWVSCVWTSSVCVSKLWEGDGERQEERTGVHNQKQEPHNKMWGKHHQFCFLHYFLYFVFFT